MRDDVLALLPFIVATVLVLAAFGSIQVYSVQTGSMEPEIQPGDDIITIVHEDAKSPVGVRNRISPAETREVQSFGAHGDVIVFHRDGNTQQTVVIHRAMFWVDEGENWYDRADSSRVHADSCADLTNCPAPHSGYITAGDANPVYDQAGGVSEPVKPEWIVARALWESPF